MEYFIVDIQEEYARGRKWVILVGRITYLKNMGHSIDKDSEKIQE